MLKKTGKLIISIIVIIIGVQIIFVRGYKSLFWGRYMDYGPFHQGIGIIVVIFGLLLLYNVLKIIIRDRRKHPPSQG